MAKINRSKLLFFLIILFIFAILLIANHYTYYICDDFGYCNNCATDEKLSMSLSEHLESIAFHTKCVNGRYLAHFFAQYMLCMPKWVFNIVNSAVFVLIVILCYFIAVGFRCSINNLLLFGIFEAIWIFEPLFGQTNLWTMGACNYLWAIAFTVGALVPFIKWLYKFDVKSMPAVGKVSFVILAFVAGAYNEVASSTVIFVSFLILVFNRLAKHVKIPKFLMIIFFASFAGFCTMLFSPAEINAKASELSLYNILNNLVYCAEVYMGFWPLYASYLVLLIWGAASDRKLAPQITLSVILMLGSVFSNFLFVVAAYYPGRAAITPFIYILLANVVITGAIFQGENKKLAVFWPLLIVPLFVYNLIVGLDDIHFTNYQARLTVEYIDNCKLNGELDVYYPDIKADTTYSAYYGLNAISCEDSNAWMNKLMASYFEVNSVTGVDSIKDIKEIKEIAW